MRQELIEKIMFMLQRYDIDKNELQTSLTIALNDYEVTARETALAVRDEDKNAYYLRKFIIAKTVKGCTERTIGYYSTELRKIIDNIGKSVEDITADDIRYYLALRERRDKVSRTTMDNELRCLRSFFNWLQQEELLTRNPTVKLDKIKGPKKKKPAFTEMEVEKIRAACQNNKETAIVEVLLSTGCRVSELVCIQLQDIVENSLTVHGKGEKDRIVYLNAKAQIALEKYVKERNDSNPYLFPRMIAISKMDRKRLKNAYKYSENVLPDGHMDKSSVEQTVRKIAKRCDVVGAHPHRFRRTCATFALRRGMPIEQVSKMLGHEQIGTTQIYLDLDEKDLEQAHRKYVV